MKQNQKGPLTAVLWALWQTRVCPRLSGKEGLQWTNDICKTVFLFHLIYQLITFSVHSLMCYVFLFPSLFSFYLHPTCVLRLSLSFLLSSSSVCSWVPLALSSFFLWRPPWLPLIVGAGKRLTLQTTFDEASCLLWRRFAFLCHYMGCKCLV